MKKILIVLIVLFFGLITYIAIINRKIEKPTPWAEFQKIAFFNKSTDSYFYLLRYANNIRVKVEGETTPDDIATLNKTIKSLSELIKPLKITLSDSASNMHFQFVNSRDFKNKTKNISNDFVNRNVIRYSPYGSEFRTEKSTSFCLISYKIEYAVQIIQRDLIDQKSRNRFIIQGLVKMIMGQFDIKNSHGFLSKSEIIGKGDWGIGEILPYNKGVFCVDFKGEDLTSTDKYIIKTYYTPASSILFHFLHEHYINAKQDKKNAESKPKLMFIISILLLLIVFICYQIGYFNKYAFSFFEKRIKNKWLFLNVNVIIIIATILLTTRLIVLIEGLYDPFVLRNHVLLLFFLIPINLIYFNEKKLLPRFNQFFNQQFLSFILLVGGYLLATYINKAFVKHTTDFNLSTEIIIASIFAIVRFIYNYTGYQKKLLLIEKNHELAQLRELKARAELNALQSRINPHFLYNALNSIAGLAHENADKVEKMALSLSKLFRYSINKDESDYNSVKNEVEIASIYLEIEQVRFGNRLNYIFSVEKDTEELKIPKFIIQPLIENSIKHGISNVTGEGILKLEIAKMPLGISIIVSDNGPGFPENAIRGYGLQSVYEKLDILYPNKYEITIKNGIDKHIQVLLK